VYVGCLLLWELLTGRKAIERNARPDAQLGLALASPSFPALATLRPDLPRVLLDAVASGLGTNPDGRGLTAEDMSNVLRTVADLDEGRRSLVETLAALRAPAVEEQLAGTTSQTQDVITPVTPSAAERRGSSNRPVSLSGHAPPQSPGAALWLAALVALSLFVALALRLRAHAPPTSVAASAAAAAPQVASPSVPSAASASPSVLAVPSAQGSAYPSSEMRDATSGTITVPASRVGHRVWIDEHLVGEAPGRYAVSCGAHSIRVGSQGELQHVNVVCNGEVLIP
jgi:hypothetical protein